MTNIPRATTWLVSALCGVGLTAGTAWADTMQSLIAGAKNETALRVTLHPGIPPAAAQKAGKAFNSRYGLNIELKADLTGRYSGKAAKGAIEHRIGSKPSYDVMVLNESAFITLALADALERVDGWEKMLPAGADKSASPGPIAGIGFKCCDLYWGYSYKPGKLDAGMQPLALKDMGNPALKGKVAMSLFASNITYAIMKYDKATLLGMAKAWGANKVKRIHPTAMAHRIALGEYAVGGFQSTEQYLDAKQKGGDLGIELFKDFIPHGVLLHAVRKGSQSPNAAKLFALWSTGREAVRIFGESTNLGSVLYGRNEAISIAQKEIANLGVKPSSFFDSEENYAKLKWLGSKAGKKFRGQLVRAIKGGGKRGKK